MKWFSKEYTLGASAIQRVNAEDLYKDYPRLELPAKGIFASGDATFTIDLNEDSSQRIKVYSTPFRTPIIMVDVFGFQINAANTKKVTVHLLYEPKTHRGELKKT